MCHPAETDDFYSLLRDTVSSVAKRDELWIFGDFNAKTGSGVPGMGGPVGCFSKHLTSNSNGERLTEFCEDHNLVLCTALFKHCMQHRSTWFADGLTHADGKPVRNQIDFVIARRSSAVIISDARSYGGFLTRSDHHPVIAVSHLPFGRARSLKKSVARCFVRYSQPTPDTTKVYLDSLISNLPGILTHAIKSTTDIDNLWDAFTATLHDGALTTL